MHYVMCISLNFSIGYFCALKYARDRKLKELLLEVSLKWHYFGRFLTVIDTSQFCVQIALNEFTVREFRN